MPANGAQQIPDISMQASHHTVISLGSELLQRRWKRICLGSTLTGALFIVVSIAAYGPTSPEKS